MYVKDDYLKIVPLLAQIIFDSSEPWEQEALPLEKQIEELTTNPLATVKYLVERFIESTEC